MWGLFAAVVCHLNCILRYNDTNLTYQWFAEEYSVNIYSAFLMH